MIQNNSPSSIRTNKHFPEITRCHVIGMCMILLGHFFQKAQRYSLGEVFIIGVPLFLLVAGFLAGQKDITSAGEYYKKKAKRILIPYALLLIPTLLIYTLSDRIRLSVFQILILLFNVQGFENYGRL